MTGAFGMHSLFIRSKFHRKRVASGHGIENLEEIANTRAHLPVITEQHLKHDNSKWKLIFIHSEFCDERIYIFSDCTKSIDRNLKFRLAIGSLICIE